MNTKHKNEDVLEVENLTVRRGNNTLLSNLNFTLSSGDMIWVKGGNGIGKTSLLHCCAGLLRPHEGMVLWNGQDITKHTTNHAAFQGHKDSHKPELSLIENLNFWQNVEGEQKDEHDIATLLNRVGLYSQRNLRAKNLSAGQSRRLALAQLLLRNAPLWILDEPSAAMDVKGRDLIESLLQDHIANNGCVLLASHGAPARIGTHTRILTLNDRDTDV